MLDIGCGTGYLLKLLHDCGAILEGVDPGDYGRIGREKYHLNIKQGFFDCRDYTKQFDIIIFYGVLEHIAEYNNFLKDVKTLLQKNGKIILSVPDCERYISQGDETVFLAEHWNYFTQSTLQKVLHRHGLYCELEKAGVGGAIYGCCSFSDAVESENKDEVYPRFDIDAFFTRVKQGREKIKNLWMLIMKNPSGCIARDES